MSLSGHGKLSNVDKSLYKCSVEVFSWKTTPHKDKIEILYKVWYVVHLYNTATYEKKVKCICLKKGFP